MLIAILTVCSLQLNQRNYETGHAGAMLQARRLGKALVVGIHSDQAILENKGPTVMSLNER
jgi:glycerol-3-phosphate cytidylyltransferase-like family protein